jgi:hypothetical protein
VRKLPELRILIIGGASLDTLAGADGLVPGGAGMYTAMSAHRSGATVTLYAPRPVPVPDALLPVNDRITWLGPEIAQDELAHFEIHYDQGRADYVVSEFGSEDSLSTAELPDDLSQFDCIHIIPLGNIRRQYEIMSCCRERGARQISAGTALDLINAQPGIAATVLQEADVLFMNEDEAIRLFGSMSAVRSQPGQLIYVTKGRHGASVIQGDYCTDLAGEIADVVDPTGAGDTFCGATLVGIASGMHPVMAARCAMPLAAHMTEAIGPAALLLSAPPPGPAIDNRVVVDDRQVARVAALIADVADIAAFPFTGSDLPPIDHPATLDYFFATTLQQFGFWAASNGRYERPLIATIDGAERKGAFYLFRAYLRWLENEPERLTPAGQAALTKQDLQNLLCADDETVPMPALDLHLSMAQKYGRDMLALGLSTQSLVARANATDSPLWSLLRHLDHIGGYKEDPLRKKASLLAIILQQRPENFLRDDVTDAPPIVDYHIMRSCLRTGLIDVRDRQLSNQLIGRELLSETNEWAVRMAAHSAIEKLVTQSGKSMGAVDWFFFQARKRCPEMTEPLCEQCAVDPVCAHHKTLFQPVRRTSFY